MAAIGKVAKVASDDVERLLDELRTATDPYEIAVLRQEIEDAIAALAAENSDAATKDVAEAAAVASDELEALLSQANARAVAYAAQRAGELVTEIDETTRADIRELVGKGVEEGWTNDEFSANLSESFTFDGARSDMIARTETAFAENRGTIEGWKASGLVEGKQWLADDEACDDCAELDGEEVGIDEDFSSGDDGPPAHPNCECTLIAVLAGEESE